MSPSECVRRSLKWFAATFTKSCSCPPLDVRLEGGRVECGRCSKPIELRP